MEKSSLAAAMAAKRLARRKKMAMGGDVNEDLNPMHEASHEAEDAVLKEMDYSLEDQEQETQPHPEEPGRSLDPDNKNYRKYTPKKDYPQSYGQADFYADGGEVEKPKPSPSPYDMTPMEEAQASMRKAFGSPKKAHGGMMHGPKAIAMGIRQKKMAQGGYLPEDMNYLAENDSYPDVDNMETDMLDKESMSPENQKAKKRERLAMIMKHMGANQDY